MPAPDVVHVLAGHGQDQIRLLDVPVGELMAPVPVDAPALRGEGVPRPAAHRLPFDHVGAGSDDPYGCRYEHRAGHHRARRIPRAQREEDRCRHDLIRPIVPLGPGGSVGSSVHGIVASHRRHGTARPHGAPPTRGSALTRPPTGCYGSRSLGTDGFALPPSGHTPVRSAGMGPAKSRRAVTWTSKVPERWRRWRAGTDRPPDESNR